ncbi:MAG: GNAT family N-acetyltransferase, partial [Bacteroidetes bacterium]|nr:GNAT family N-acetyltransferase [Bacteroidota bacterium]
MAARQRIQHRFERHNRPSLRNWNAASELSAEAVKRNVTIDCGWGKLIFGHTFEDHSALIEQLGKEEKDRRDIAFYIRDPHVILALAPQELFLDPSHTYRLWLDQYRTSRKKISNCIIRKLQSRSDIAGMNDVYRMRKMTIAPNEFVWNHRNTRLLTYFVAEDSASGDIVGSVLGVDHHVAFQDVENGSSLWCLAVDPQANTPGIGEALVRVLAEHYIAKGRSFMDLSVLHDNAQAIRLYEKLGFKRVPVFCIKRKTNPVNEQLFTGPSPDQ